ncbi:hypothetical protein [Streptomyces sp. KR80]|uniref:hypothetical protein n=1 Tax=Streptomyces sp. KR80 TaxID=3457426 RepID=UPI003FD44C03
MAAALLALSVPGHPETFGAPAMVRNTVGVTGLTAGSAARLGARLSWLPALVYLGPVYLTAPRKPGGPAAVWAWPMQPGPQTAAWWTAGAMFAAGAALLAVRGPRPEGAGSPHAYF